MNRSYFAMERRLTFKVKKKNTKYNKKTKPKANTENKTKNNKQADKPKQNKMKIYKRAKEEYSIHAQ